MTLKLSELIIELSFYDFLGAQQVVVLILSSLIGTARQRTVSFFYFLSKVMVDCLTK